MLSKLRWLPMVSQSHMHWGLSLSNVHKLENISVFNILWRHHELTVNFLVFPSIKFCKIWQTGFNFFILVGAHFQEIYEQFFSSSRRQILKNWKKMPVQTLRFSCLKFISHRLQCAVNILEEFTEGNSRKPQIKP